jgi:nucleolar pre-ribosomal-associated protein 1
MNAMKQIRELLQVVLVENSILTDSHASFDALALSLRDSDSDSLLSRLQFLDNCLCRIAKKPVHYEDLVTSLLDSREEGLSALVATANEQWPFVLKNKDSSKEESIASWLASLLRHLKVAGEDKTALKTVRDNLSELSESKKTRSIFKKAFKGGDETEHQDQEMPDADVKQQTHAHAKSPADLLDIFGMLPVESRNHTELYKWENDEMDVAIEQGQIRDLVLCLCSEYEEIRRQAFTVLTRLMAKLKVRDIENSTYV